MLEGLVDQEEIQLATGGVPFHSAQYQVSHLYCEDNIRGGTGGHMG